MEHNYMKEFESGPPLEQSCENPVNGFREVFFKKTFADAPTDTIAPWPLASGAKNPEDPVQLENGA